jgi:hypothetical protein
MEGGETYRRVIRAVCRKGCVGAQSENDGEGSIYRMWRRECLQPFPPFLPSISSFLRRLSFFTPSLVRTVEHG